MRLPKSLCALRTHVLSELDKVALLKAHAYTPASSQSIWQAHPDCKAREKEKDKETIERGRKRNMETESGRERERGGEIARVRESGGWARRIVGINIEDNN